MADKESRSRTAVKRLTTLVSLTVSFAVIISAMALARIELHGAAGPLLWWNDRSWGRESKQGIEKIYEVYYIPVTIFNQFEGVEVNTNTTFKTFIIANGDKYLSFETTTDFAITNEYKRIFIKTFELHGDRYVPARTVCEYLGLGYEQLTSSITGEVAIRITDGNQQTGFAELLKSKYPGFFENTGTTYIPPSTDTAPPDTGTDTTEADTTEPAKVLGERTIYLTVEDSPGEYTEDILELLAEFGVKATFFVIGDKAAESPELLSRIVAEGHTVALHTMEHDQTKLKSADAILADIEAENELLVSLIRRRSHIWRAPNGSAKLTTITTSVADRLAEQGIEVWDYNLEATGKTAARAAKQVIDGIWAIETPVIRFVDGELTCDTMRAVLEFIRDNSRVCTLRTASPAYEGISSITRKG